MGEDLGGALVRYVLEHQREPLIVLDRQGRVVESNRSARALGPAFAELFEKRPANPCVAKLLDELARSGEGQAVLCTTGGGRYRLEGSALDRWFVVVAREPAEQSHGDDEMRELRSRASLGLVAAGLVHDMNNLLTPILIISSRLVRELGEGSKAMMANLIHTSAQLAAALTRDVLALARPRTPIIERVDVNEAVRELKPLLERLLGDDVELVVSLDDQAGDAMVDRKRLEHALLNLVVNARDAMPEGGRIAIDTTAVEEEGRKRVVVAVRDNGVGMTDDVKRRAFDSFFTTKADSGGVGLGLPSVQRFAVDSGGEVTIDTAPRAGTTIAITLNRMHSEAPARAPSSKLPPSVGGETILIVDPDERVKLSIRLALEAEGYVVLTAGTQETALEIATKHPLQLALIDDRLLRRDPRGFLQRLHALRPRLRFVFMSETATREWIPNAFVTVLAKAFSHDDLLRSVRLLIGRGT